MTTNKPTEKELEDLDIEAFDSFNDTGWGSGTWTASSAPQLFIQEKLRLVENKQDDQWDESLRGKKMSDSTGKVIFKYQMPVLESFTMKLPRGAEIIRVADQGGMFWLWAVVDTNEPDEMRDFVAVKCGANVPDGNLKYIGFCAIFVQQELGLYIFEKI